MNGNTHRKENVDDNRVTMFGAVKDPYVDLDDNTVGNEIHVKNHRNAVALVGRDDGNMEHSESHSRVSEQEKENVLVGKETVDNKHVLAQKKESAGTAEENQNKKFVPSRQKENVCSLDNSGQCEKVNRFFARLGMDMITDK